ncbi:hypothetical protein NIES37_65870 [Tolypothrix tenuis PCC 7101]|uniref:Uncharacterized protein n=1 Tax=Tolypothrix tenuis PCC 7101 TaxID=231146 RepID=A0A1Z4NA22_9CYAN|nr:hypothetical protein [Aulosira sp. FACHB-113]BAZ02574.1 hypothetical protein NIES37_65870 [Tolypothrix tenuis PCC 7101]BAZ73505.1 hypothetical protein NIES50_20700 [Aulosira laxa NIES-50]
MTAFVGVKEKLLSVAKLLDLIQEFAIEPSYYFLRWTHKVSDNWKQVPTENDFPMLEGQMFNQNCELRWKYKRKDSYEVLLLSVAGEYADFSPVGKDWDIQDRNAHLYGSTETRFPKGFPEKAANIAQRYFIDKQTSTVHFVALTITQ